MQFLPPTAIRLVQGTNLDTGANAFDAALGFWEGSEERI
jgi:hypothetical protein